MGQCQGHTFLTAKDKNMRFLPIHSSYTFLCIKFIILLVFTLEQQEIYQNEI